MSDVKKWYWQDDLREYVDDDGDECDVSSVVSWYDFDSLKVEHDSYRERAEARIAQLELRLKGRNGKQADCPGCADAGLREDSLRTERDAALARAEAAEKDAARMKHLEGALQYIIARGYTGASFVAMRALDGESYGT